MRAINLHISEHELRIELENGLTLSVPLEHYPRLATGTPAQRARWQLLGDGEGICWAELDEDLSVTTLAREAASRPLFMRPGGLERMNESFIQTWRQRAAGKEPTAATHVFYVTDAAELEAALDDPASALRQEMRQFDRVVIEVPREKAKQ